MQFIVKSGLVSIIALKICDSRRFPASPAIVKDARNKIRLKMKAKFKDDDSEMLDENLSQQIVSSPATWLICVSWKKV